jgi:hypothetical protein
MPVNFSKTKVIVFHTKGKKIPMTLKFTLKRTTNQIRTIKTSFLRVKGTMINLTISTVEFANPPWSLF